MQNSFAFFVKWHINPREWSNDKSTNFKALLWCFANGPGDLCSIPGRVIPKILKMVPDTSLLNTQQYKVRIESKVGKE